ncbi:unnamed protein product, partial [Symbiodinium pilosum]
MGAQGRATWRLQAADLQSKSKGDEIVSPPVRLWHHLFVLKFHPRGDKDARSGNCSLFLGATEGCKFELRINGVSCATQTTWEVTPEQVRKVGGCADFGPQPDLSSPVDMEVRFHSIAGKNADALQKEAMCYYEKLLFKAFQDQMLERSQNLQHATTRIQASWRMWTGRKLARSRLAEKRRSVKRAKELAAVLREQLSWRLYQRRLQRRWHSKLSKSQATPYDAVLAFESWWRVPGGAASWLWWAFSTRERRMLVLDSAGVQSTVSYQKQAVDAILDAQTTESLMFEMISRIAHHMIFVVNDLTWFEQKYVAMLHQKYVQGGQQKELVVVHNLRNTTNKAEACKLFKRQVMRCYDGEQSHLGELIFTQDAGNGAPPLRHIGLCYEFSLAGDAFNEKNRQHLLQSL